MARVVFLGTPEFGVPVLQALLAHHEVVAVVTQPDRVGGRGRAQLLPPPVKEVAQAHGVPVLQPERLRRDREVVARLRDLGADVFVLAAYGQIIRRKVLAIPRLGCIGVHASLLPKYRGAAPITAAILHGERETGVSLMLTDEGMDTGPVLAQRAIAIAPDDTTETLSPRLAQLGADLVIETLPAWLAGQVTPQPQDDALATYAPLIAREDSLIDWNLPAEVIDRAIRAYTPWPGAFTTLDGLTLKVLYARPLPDEPSPAEPGRVVQAAQGIVVATGHGLLLLETVQLAGKRAMSAQDLARGQRNLVGSLLGQSDNIT
ncbi:MAG: methionyl-tRNA formyltransferase [Anaerolineae bacterium]